MDTLTELQRVMGWTAKDKVHPKEIVKPEVKKPEVKKPALTEEMIEKLRHLPPDDVAKIAIMLSERFPSIDPSKVEADLPRVGEVISDDAVVTKVEQRDDSRNQVYWVVRVLVDDKTQSKKVSVVEGMYEVAWKEGERWCKTKVPPSELRAELAKRIGK